MFLSRITNGISAGNQTPWTNADKRLNPLSYYWHGLSQEIATRELGWIGGFNYRLKYIGEVSELSH